MMAERVLPPDGLLLPGSPGKTCTFSKQLQLASLGQDCSYNPYCPTSILKHPHIPSHFSTHPFTLIYALLYFSCSPPLLYTSPSNPSHIHAYPSPPSQSLKPLTPSTSLSTLSLCHIYPPPLPFPCDMHLRIHYVMLSACIQFRVRLVFKEVMTCLQWTATKWKEYTSMSKWTPDGDDNDIVSSPSKLELV